MKIPEIKDFTEVIPPEDALDGFHAWKEFGGLDLAEAYTKFCSHPGYYQEDLMFMGARAFLFYFPVIDRYIREIECPANRFDDEAWILACGLRIQFEKDARTLAPIRDRAEQLCDFVSHGLSQLPEGATFRPIQEITDAWAEAKAAVTATTGNGDVPSEHPRGQGGKPQEGPSFRP